MTFFLAFQDQVPVPGPDLMPPIWTTIGALAVVIGLFVGVAYLLRRSTRIGRPGRSLAIESALGLGERRSLVIVTVEGRRLLLGLGPGQVSLVTELQAAPDRGGFDAAVARATKEEAGS